MCCYCASISHVTSVPQCLLLHQPVWGSKPIKSQCLDLKKIIFCKGLHHLNSSNSAPVWEYSFTSSRDVKHRSTASLKCWLCYCEQEHRNLPFMQELRNLFSLMVGSKRKYVDPSQAVEILKDAFKSSESQQVNLFLLYPAWHTDIHLVQELFRNFSFYHAPCPPLVWWCMFCVLP